MDMYQLRPGMLVQDREGKVMRVEKPKVKKVTLIDEAGTRWDYYPGSLSPAPADATFDLAITEATGLTLGSTARFSPTTPNGFKYPYPLVVTGVSRGNEYQLAKLGGDGGRYFRTVPASALEKISLAEALDLL